jgi:hypothetical protein
MSMHPHMRSRFRRADWDRASVDRHRPQRQETGSTPAPREATARQWLALAVVLGAFALAALLLSG